jgi:hypothetical protein
MRKPTSQISKLSISTTHPGLKHIKSFRRLVYMVIPHMKKMPHNFKVEHDGVSYAIYVTSDDVTCTNCRKPGHVARNCHTPAQARVGPITFADLAAGRRVTTPHPPAKLSVPRNSSTGKHALSDESTTAFLY